jgi:acyl-CoA synthetase (AMP-forming)/AMP-acid ligase II
MSSYGTVVELQQLFQDAGITRLFVAPSHLAIALPAARAAGLREEHIYLLEGSAPGRRSLGDMIDAVVARKITPVQSRPVEKDTLAYLLFSSGTSGRPKAVMVSHTNLLTQLLQGALVQQVADAAVTVCACTSHPRRSLAQCFTDSR